MRAIVRFGLLCLPAALLLAPLHAGEAPKTEGPSAERDSPRATVGTFLASVFNYRKGIDKSDVQRAVKCMDLKGAGIGSDLGPRHAEMLKDVIDRFWFVHMDQIPENWGEPTWTRSFERDGRRFTLALAKQPNGEWLFAAEMLREIESIYRVVEDWPLVSAQIQATQAQDIGLRIEREWVPRALRKTRFLLKDWQWIALLILVGMGVLLDWIVGLLVTWSFRRWLKGQNVELEKKEVRMIERPAGLAAMALVWWLGLHWLVLPADIHRVLATIGIFFLAFSFVWATYRLVDILSAYLLFLARKSATKMDDLLVPLVRRTLKIFIVAFGVVFVAGNLGIDVTAILAGLTITGAAVALASKDTVENLFGSVTVLLDQPFQIGDQVNIMGIKGRVVEVGFRSTRLRTSDQTVIALPNSRLVAAHIENWGPANRRRFLHTVALKNSPSQEKLAAFRDALKACLAVREAFKGDPVEAFVCEVTGSAAKVQIAAWLRAPSDAEENAAREQVLFEIARLAKEKDLELA